MEDNRNIPSSDFNLFLAADAVQGVLDAIHAMMADIPETEPARARWLDNLQGLAWAGRDQAHRDECVPG